MGLVVSLGGCATRSQAVERAEVLLARSQPREGQLVFSCQPSDAEVVVDGVPQGICTDYARGLEVGEGLHEIEVKKPGYWPYLTYYAPDGTRAALRITLRPKPAEGGSP
ncbi:MAG: PEGA domain-containing protein [Myxococcota bacterium]